MYGPIGTRKAITTACSYSQHTWQLWNSSPYTQRCACTNLRACALHVKIQHNHLSPSRRLRQPAPTEGGGLVIIDDDTGAVVYKGSPPQLTKSQELRAPPSGAVARSRTRGRFGVVKTAARLALSPAVAFKRLASATVRIITQQEAKPERVDDWVNAAAGDYDGEEEGLDVVQPGFKVRCRKCERPHHKPEEDYALMCCVLLDASLLRCPIHDAEAIEGTIEGHESVQLASSFIFQLK